REVRLDAESLDPRLRVRREFQVVRLEEIEEAALEGRVAACTKLLDVEVPRQRSRRRLNLSVGEQHKHVTDEVPVEGPVVGLVRVRKQAVVASRRAVFPRTRSAVTVLASVRIEVADLERLARNARQGLGLRREQAEDAGPALGRLVEEELTAKVAVRERLNGELGVFEVVDDLDRV